LCCFCGGDAATEDRDHIPPKVTFIGSKIPGNLNIEFPACRPCNCRSSQYDQIAAILSFSTPRNLRAGEREQFLKAVGGVRNNSRAALIEINQGFVGQRSREKAVEAKHGLPVKATELGPISKLAFFTLAAKLGLAYYFRETGRIVPKKGAVIVDVVTNTRILDDDVNDGYRLGTPFTDMTSNLELKEQILYRH
jgi:hypothetical protein